MTPSSIRFPLYFLADERVRLLSSYEIADFAFRLYPLAAMQRKPRREGDWHPGVIPSMPLATLARKLSIPAKRLLKRLEALSRPGVELIALEYDSPLAEGAIAGALNLLSTVRVEILDFAEWNGLDDGQGTGDAARVGSGGFDAFPSGGSTERVAKHRAKKRQLEELQRQISQLNAEIEQDAPGNNLANAPGNAQALQQALQNGAPSVTSTPNEALPPSRTRDDNVQRLSPNLNSNSNQDSTLNDSNVTGVTPETPPAVSPTPQSLGARNPGRPPNLRASGLAIQAVRIARGLNDDAPRPGFPQGNVPRHYQLLAICEENGLSDVIPKALAATDRRQRPGKPPLRSAGAYYCDTVIRMLRDHNVHVPTSAELEAEPAADVQRLIRESMDAAAHPPGVIPLEDVLPEMEDE